MVHSLKLEDDPCLTINKSQTVTVQDLLEKEQIDAVWLYLLSICLSSYFLYMVEEVSFLYVAVFFRSTKGSDLFSHVSRLRNVTSGSHYFYVLSVSWTPVGLFFLLSFVHDLIPEYCY